MSKLEAIDVECYAGYKANETPKGFVYNDKHYNITEILDRWYEGGIKAGAPQLDYYKIKVEDGAEYIIRYNHLFDSWALV